MALKRVCVGCEKELLPGTRYLDIMVQVKRADEDNDQDSITQSYEDFCLECALNGTAIEMLVDDDVREAVETKDDEPDATPPAPRSDVDALTTVERTDND